MLKLLKLLTVVLTVTCVSACSAEPKNHDIPELHQLGEPKLCEDKPELLVTPVEQPADVRSIKQVATTGCPDMDGSYTHDNVVIHSLKGQGVDAIYNFDHIVTIGKSNDDVYPSVVSMVNGLTIYSDFTTDQWADSLLSEIISIVDKPCPLKEPVTIKPKDKEPVKVKQESKCSNGQCGRGYNNRPKKGWLFR